LPVKHTASKNTDYQ